MIDSIEKDLEQYLQTHPELSDFGYNDAYNNGDLMGIISAKNNMKKHEEVYNDLEERLSLKDDERAYTSLFDGLVKAAIFAVVGSIPIVGMYTLHNWWTSDIDSEIKDLEVNCHITEDNRGVTYPVISVNATAYDADGDEIDLSIKLDNGDSSRMLVGDLKPYEISEDGKTQYFHLAHKKGSSFFGSGDVLIVNAYTGWWSEDDSKNTILDCDGETKTISDDDENKPILGDDEEFELNEDREISDPTIYEVCLAGSAVVAVIGWLNRPQE